MKYFGSPGSCSLSPHIALREAGLPFEYMKVDLRAKRTANDEDYRAINPKGYVPALVLENGELLTENPVILQWIADQVPAKKLAPANGTMERYRFQEWLNFICSELHKTVFGPQFNPRAPEEWKQVLRGLMEVRFAIVEAHLKDHEYMVGNAFTLADSYLFTIVRWTGPMKIDLSPWPALKAHHARIGERPHVKAAMQAEGLI